MDGKRVKFLVPVMAIVWFACFLNSPAMAGITIEEYNLKLNGTEGVITGVEANELTLLTDSGRTLILKVKGLIQENEALLKIGDHVKIQDGEIASNAMMINPGLKKRFDPQPEPPGKLINPKTQGP